MKVLFTADWHIKLGQKNVPVEWAINRFNEMVKQVLAIESDYLIVGGDIFDRAPTLDELALYFSFVQQCNRRTIIYSGNHEAVKKNTTFLSQLKEVTTSINPNVIIIDDFFTLDNIDFIPYNKLKEYYPSDIDFHGDILCTHVRGEIPPHVKPEVNLEIFDRWKVVLAGDLHSYDNCQRNILYPGSPVTTSFHRSLVDTGVILIDTDTLEHEWKILKLPQLLKKTANAGDDLKADSYHTVIYEVEGTMDELSRVNDSSLVGKKITTRQSDPSLYLEAEMTIADEVKEYLSYILLLEESAVSRITNIVIETKIE